MQRGTLLIISLINLHPHVEDMLYPSYITHTSPNMQPPFWLQTSLMLIKRSYADNMAHQLPFAFVELHTPQHQKGHQHTL